RYSNNGTQWSNSTEIPNINTNKPVQAFIRSGTYTIVYIGLDGNMYYQYFGDGGWKRPAGVGYSNSNVESLSIVIDGGFINSYYNDANQRLQHIYSNTPITNWVVQENLYYGTLDLS
ncbi:MAG: hypothetical protein AAGF07_04610, partial [Patescibacteria group bacterium]